MANHLLNKIATGIKTAAEQIQQPTAPEKAKIPPVPESDVVPLNKRSPFAIGFFIAMGAFTAYGLLNVTVQLQSVLVLIGLSLFLALGLNPPVEKLQGLGLRRGVAVIMVVVTVLALIALASSALVPVISDQLNILINNLPGYLHSLRENQQIAEIDYQYRIIEKVTDFISSGDWIEKLFGGLLGASKLVAGTVFNLIITLVLTIYFLASLPNFKEVIYQLAPASRRPRVKYLANEMFSRIGGYMNGLFLVVICASTTAFIFLNIVGLGQYSLALAVVVAMFAFIPLVGSTCSMVIISIIAFSFSTSMGVTTLIFFLIYQQIDTYIIQPRIFSSSVNVPGIIVIVAALSGGILLGVVGAFMAIPTAAVLQLLYQEVLLPHLDRS